MTCEVSCPAVDDAWVLSRPCRTVFSQGLDASAMEREKQAILEEIQQLRDNPNFLGRLLLMQLLFAGHPYGRSPLGEKASSAKPP